MARIFIEFLGALVVAAVGFYYGYTKCMRDHKIR